MTDHEFEPMPGDDVCMYVNDDGERCMLFAHEHALGAIPPPQPLSPRDMVLNDIRDKVTAQYSEGLDFTAIEDVHESIALAYKASIDVRVFNGSTHKSHVGRVALARGPRPEFLLVEPKWKGGVIPLGHNDVVVARRVSQPGSKAKWVNTAKVEVRNGSEVK